MQVGSGPLNTPSFSLLNPNGVIDIPTNAFVTIDASGPDVLLTSQLTGACNCLDRPMQELPVKSAKPIG